MTFRLEAYSRDTAIPVLLSITAPWQNSDTRPARINRLTECTILRAAVFASYEMTNAIGRG